MEEILKLIGSYGGLVVLAALFVLDHLKSTTQQENLLKRIDTSNDNIAKSIDAINNTTGVLKEYIIKHDERAKKIDENVEKILFRERGI